MQQTPNKDVCYCEKCHKTMASSNFYTHKDGTKHELCKPCLTLHVDNFNPETYLWILKSFDVPYVEREWVAIREKALAQDPKHFSGLSVLGKYLSLMRLKHWKNYTWADSEMLGADSAPTHPTSADKINQMRQAYQEGEITEEQLLTYTGIQSLPPAAPEVVQSISPVAESLDFDIPDIGSQLTKEDKSYLALKWGRSYNAEDWVYLEQKYKDFAETFEVEDAARIDTLIQICKLSLKLNQAIDIGDMDTYAKLVKAYDALMKSGKFTEAQKKEAAEKDFDSIGALVAFCEKEGGFIPEYNLDIEQDVVDSIIADNQEFLTTLINNDTNLSQQIESYLKKRELLEAMQAEKTQPSAMVSRSYDKLMEAIGKGDD